MACADLAYFVNWLSKICLLYTFFDSQILVSMALKIIPFLERIEWLTLSMSSDYMN
jgi:hypothetical protein